MLGWQDLNSALRSIPVKSAKEAGFLVRTEPGVSVSLKTPELLLCSPPSTLCAPALLGDAWRGYGVYIPHTPLAHVHEWAWKPYENPAFSRKLALSSRLAENLLSHPSCFWCSTHTNFHSSGSRMQTYFLTCVGVTCIFTLCHMYSEVLYIFL